jgi:predicted dehydrogenase
VIGSSYGTTVQVPGFRHVQDVELVGLASGRLERAREMAAKHGIPHAYDDYRAMLDEVPLDLVTIVTPPYLHHEMVLEAVRRGIHVICEKPFARDVAEAEAMLRAAEAAGVVHAIDHEFRFLPAHQAFRERVRDGFIGRPRLVRIVNVGDARVRPDSVPFTWWSERSKGGGVVTAVASHYLDALRVWFGDVRDVTAVADTFVRERPLRDGPGMGAVTSDDTATILLHLAESGAQASITTSMAVAGRLQRVEAYGSEGSLVIEDGMRLLGGRVGEPLAELSIPPEPLPVQPGLQRMIGQFATLAGRVAQRIRGEAAGDFPTFADGVAVQRLLDAVFLSAREGRRVELA